MAVSQSPKKGTALQSYFLQSASPAQGGGGGDGAQETTHPTATSAWPAAKSLTRLLRREVGSAPSTRAPGAVEM